MILHREYYDELKKKEEIEKISKIMSSPILRIRFLLKKILPKVIIRLYKALINNK
jgi:hypothetical protein